jgi:hypothetical protein
MTLRVDTWAGLAAFLTGLFFFWGAGKIEIYGGETIPPDFVPRASATLMCAAGIALMIKSQLSESATETIGVTGLSAFVRVTLPLVGATLLYILAWRAFGFLAATLLLASPVFLAFGNRGLRDAALIPIGVAVVFYVVFFIGMGLFDAPGSFVDLGEIFRSLARR